MGFCCCWKSLNKFATKLKQLRYVLIVWNKSRFGNLFKNISEAEDRVRDAELKEDINDSTIVKENLNTRLVLILTDN